jgi:hypothetical protein
MPTVCMATRWRFGTLMLSDTLSCEYMAVMGAQARINATCKATGRRVTYLLKIEREWGMKGF